MKCRLVFKMSNGDTHRSDIFDGPGFATDWLESGMKWECPDRSGERFIILTREKGQYKLINPKYIVSISLEEYREEYFRVLEPSSKLTEEDTKGWLLE